MPAKVSNPPTPDIRTSPSRNILDSDSESEKDITVVNTPILEHSSGDEKDGRSNEPLNLTLSNILEQNSAENVAEQIDNSELVRHLINSEGNLVDSQQNILYNAMSVSGIPTVKTRAKRQCGPSQRFDIYETSFSGESSGRGASKSRRGGRGGRGGRGVSGRGKKSFKSKAKSEDINQLLLANDISINTPLNDSNPLDISFDMGQYYYDGC